MEINWLHHFIVFFFFYGKSNCWLSHSYYYPNQQLSFSFLLCNPISCHIYHHHHIPHNLEVFKNWRRFLVNNKGNSTNSNGSRSGVRSIDYNLNEYVTYNNKDDSFNNSKSTISMSTTWKLSGALLVSIIVISIMGTCMWVCTECKHNTLLL